MSTLDVKISSMYPPGQQGGIRAYASATIDGCFAVRGIKVVEGGRDGLFVSMPSRKTVDGYKEVCFPVTAEFRSEFHNAVLDAHHGAGAACPAGGARRRDAPGRPADGRDVTEAGPQYQNHKTKKWRDHQ